MAAYLVGLVVGLAMEMHEGSGASVRVVHAVSDADIGLPRNPGMALDLGFLESMRCVNRSALERRVGTLT
ncbi:hypothetical protein GGR00_000813, partial [Aminobacter aganoensis]|nr:hypothetical protein [Aminobacter aganoensis]